MVVLVLVALSPRVHIDFAGGVSVSTGTSNGDAITLLVHGNVMSKSYQSILRFVSIRNRSYHFFSQELPRRLGFFHDFLAVPVVTTVLVVR